MQLALILFHFESVVIDVLDVIPFHKNSGQQDNKTRGAILLTEQVTLT